jgi:hypothetical protein
LLTAEAHLGAGNNLKEDADVSELILHFFFVLRGQAEVIEFFLGWF